MAHSMVLVLISWAFVGASCDNFADEAALLQRSPRNDEGLFQTTDFQAQKEGSVKKNEEVENFARMEGEQKVKRRDIPGFQYTGNVCRCLTHLDNPVLGNWLRYVALDGQSCPDTWLQSHNCHHVEIYENIRGEWGEGGAKLGEYCYCILQACPGSCNAFDDDKSTCSNNLHGIQGLTPANCGDTVQMSTYERCTDPSDCAHAGVNTSAPPAPAPVSSYCHLPGRTYQSVCRDGWALETRMYYNSVGVDKGVLSVESCKNECRQMNCAAIRAYTQGVNTIHCRLLFVDDVWGGNYRATSNDQDQVYARCSKCGEFDRGTEHQVYPTPQPQPQPQPPQQVTPPPGEWHEKDWPACNGGAATTNRMRLLSPEEHGCCSVSEGPGRYGHFGSCYSHFDYITIELDDRTERCYKGQVCEYILDEPRKSQEIVWYCGDKHWDKESRRWDLYWDFIQFQFHCGGHVEFNPWWCGFSSPTWEPAFVNTLSQLTLENLQNREDMATFVRNAKTQVCEGISYMAAYDQLLASTATCAPQHSYSGKYPDLYRERGGPQQENEDSEYCVSIGMKVCFFTGHKYCVAPDNSVRDLCLELQASKLYQLGTAVASAVLGVVFQPLKILRAGPFGAAKRIGRSVLKSTVQNVVKKAFVSENFKKEVKEVISRKAIAETAEDAIEADPFVKLAKKTMEERAKGTSTTRILADWWLNYIRETGLHGTAKANLKNNLKAALEQAGCEFVLDQALGRISDQPDWIEGNAPDAEFQAFQTADVTGVIGMLGIFHEGICPAPMPYSLAGKESCPR